MKVLLTLTVLGLLVFAGFAALAWAVMILSGVLFSAGLFDASMSYVVSYQVGLLLWILSLLLRPRTVSVNT